MSVSWWNLEHVEGVAALAFAGVGLTVALVIHPKAAVTRRRLAHWWKSKSEHERSNVALALRLVAAGTAGILITLAIGGTEVVAVCGIVGGSVFVVVLGAVYVTNRIKNRPPRRRGRHAASRSSGRSSRSRSTRRRKPAV